MRSSGVQTKTIRFVVAIPTELWKSVRDEDPPQAQIRFRPRGYENQKRVTVNRRNPFSFDLAGVLYEVQRGNSGWELEAIPVEFERRVTALVPVTVAGIGPDKPAPQKKFDVKHQLGFPLFSNPARIVTNAYGAHGEKSLYGTLTRGFIRSAVLVDAEGG